MRVFLTVLVLIFILQSWTKADEAGGFEIEGMSIGESLLDYFSEDEIKKKILSDISFYYPNKTFVSIGAKVKSDGLENYDQLGVVIKPNDKNYIIHAIEGSLYFKKNINECYKIQNIISENLENLFGDNVKIDKFTSDYIGDKSGKSKVKYVDFLFNDGSASRVICYDLSEKYHEEGDQDTLYTVVNSKEFMKFINKNMK